MVFLVSCQISFAQEKLVAHVTTISSDQPTSKVLGSASFQLIEGSQEIRLPNDLGDLVIVVTDGEVTYLTRPVEEKPYNLHQTSEDTQAMDCSCDHKCWKDYKLQQSICICKACGDKASGSSTDYYLKIQCIEEY